MENIKPRIRRTRAPSERGTSLNAACIYPNCIFQATSDKSLVNHQITCHTESFRCLYPDCRQALRQNVYANMERLRKHMKSHFLKKKWQCVQCKAISYNLCNFKRHLLSHTGAKPFACLYCDQRFTQSHSKKKHIAHKICQGGNKPLCEKKQQQQTCNDHDNNSDDYNEDDSDGDADDEMNC